LAYLHHIWRIIVSTIKESLLLPIWTEVGRHARLQESLPVIVHRMLDVLPLAAIRFDEVLAEECELQGLAQWNAHGGLQWGHRMSGYSRAELEALMRWAQSGSLVVAEPGGEWPSALPELPDLPLDAPFLLAPVMRDQRPIGLIRIEFPKNAMAGAPGRQLLDEVLAPLISLFENDYRLRELERLRATAEADRQTLLARLGRESLNETIVGADTGLRGVMERVARVAPTTASVLILGETGSGKEVIARAIHERSLRHTGPFIRVNCGALPPELIDSELFGHEKGSFTGALGVRRGWFERADCGTLFLDEVGELPLAAQIRLLRVLQDGALQRVGSEEDIQVDVRVIAATHRDLPQMVQEGGFREDLWYRIAVFPIILPPLHERLADIELLARHFIRRAAQQLGVLEPPLRPAHVQRLMEYRWPGNVRELGSVLERAVILGHGRELDLDTALGVQLVKSPGPGGDGSAVVATHSTVPLEPLDKVVALHLSRALTATRGRIDGPQGAARLLGLNPSTLRAKLRKHGIDIASARCE
jgi:transcriptional regulator with GAF, ATPase, and Fis domain